MLTPALLCTLCSVLTGVRATWGQSTPQSSAIPRPVAPAATETYTWNSVKIVDGGDMPSIVMHPSVPGLMYIRANIGLTSGLYHSTDAGASFARIGTVESSTLVGFGSPAPNAAYPAAYLVGTVGKVYGIFRSNDAGVTWSRINDDHHQYGLLSVILGDPRIYGRVYVGTSGRGILYGDVSHRNPRLPQ